MRTSVVREVARWKSRTENGAASASTLNVQLSSRDSFPPIQLPFENVRIKSLKEVIWTYCSSSLAVALRRETNEVEALRAPIIPVSEVGPVKPSFLALQAVVVGIFRVGIALISTPPLQIFN